MGYPRVKITVVKRLRFEDLYGDNPPLDYDPKEVQGICWSFKEGDEFIIEGEHGITNLPPAQFCSWAWDDIYKYVFALMVGGNPYWMKKKGACLAACTDGLNPVIFKIERLED